MCRQHGLQLQGSGEVGSERAAHKGSVNQPGLAGQEDCRMENCASIKPGAKARVEKLTCFSERVRSSGTVALCQGS